MRITLSITPPPARGQGLNTWMFATAAHLARHHVTPPEIERIIREEAGDAARTGEVERQVAEGIRRAHENAATVDPQTHRIEVKARPPKWPDVDTELMGEVAKLACPVEDLIEASPCPVPGEEVNPLDILKELHPGGGLLCMAPHPTNDFVTMDLGEWEGARDALPFWEMVVPNLMSARTGTTLEGKTSARCKSNACTAFRFVVVEIDLQDDSPILPAGVTPQMFSAGFFLHAGMPLSSLRMVVNNKKKNLHK
jgi:hypothetical protein